MNIINAVKIFRRQAQNSSPHCQKIVPTPLTITLYLLYYIIPTKVIDSLSGDCNLHGQ